MVKPMDEDDDLLLSPALKHRHIEAFRAVMIRGTATEAAVLLHTSQPVVSKLLARFQSTSGLKLFELRKSRLVPTPEARILFNTIERSYVGLEQIGQTIDELRGAHSGLIRIGCLPSLGMGFLPKIVKRFLEDHPDVELAIETVNSGIIKDSVASGRVDLGITLRLQDTAGTTAEPLESLSAVCVMSREHPLARKRSIHVGDLHRQPFISPSRNDSTFAQLQAMFAKHQVEPRLVTETTYAVTICMLALQGVGIGIVSPLVVPELVKAGLVARPLRPRLPIELSLLTPADLPPSRLAQDFIKALRRGLKERSAG
jgi:DNA-binding transcriptional LysR family regulator